ncbi:MAG: C4-dicarboxylate ABC transporter permease [Blastopirellula sp.]|nr:MAG: C4-dicarboxylate ABC transporter permease [Blastopirellula sp.]
MSGSRSTDDFQRKILRHSEALSRLAVWFSGALIIVTAVLIASEVVMRKTINVSIGGADELSGYALAISSSWAMGFALIRRAHVRVDALYTRLRFELRALLDCLGIACLSSFSCILTYYSVQVLISSVELDAKSNTTLGVPLWIPQGLWCIGLILFSTICLLLLFVCLSALYRKDFETIQGHAGSRSTDEEMEQEYIQSTRDNDHGNISDA